MASTSRVVLLTFDAGAGGGHTTQILDVLARESIPAAFGLTGQWASEHPELVRRISREGHAVMNHSFDHRSFTGFSTGEAPLGAKDRRVQLERSERILRRIAGIRTRPWFRPPYGDVDPTVFADVGRIGWHQVVLWTVDSFGWKGLTAPEITTRCLERAEPGAIYLFHVGAESQDAAALPDVVAGLRANGYQFVPLEPTLAATR